MGSRQLSAKFLDIFPSDTILETRLGASIWEMFRTTESQYSSMSTAKAVQKEKEIRQLNATAKDFVPRSSSTPDSLLDNPNDANSRAGHDEPEAGEHQSLDGAQVVVKSFSCASHILLEG